MSSQTGRAVHRPKTVRYARWTGQWDDLPVEMRESGHLSADADTGHLVVQTAGARLRARIDDYVVEGTSGLYPVPHGVFQFSYHATLAARRLGDEGWATHRPTEVEFIEWTGYMSDLPPEWRARGNFTADSMGRLVVQCTTGRMHPAIGWLLLQGPFGDFFPLRPESFDRNYAALVREEVAA